MVTATRRPGRRPGAKLAGWVVVVGICTLLAGAAVVITGAVGGPSDSPFGATVRPVVSASAPSTSAPDPGTAVVSGQRETTIVVGAAPAPAATTPPSSVAPAPPTTAGPPHFDTPQAAMTYLAAAWNANDTVALRHVTNPAARDALDAMHAEAVNLRLDHCDERPEGDYLCSFRHDYPAGTATAEPGGGQAVFLVGPALTPGWYMTVLQSCG
jgi:hypothetical protein